MSPSGSLRTGPTSPRRLVCAGDDWILTQTVLEKETYHVAAFLAGSAQVRFPASPGRQGGARAAVTLDSFTKKHVNDNTASTRGDNIVGSVRNL